MTTCLPLEMFNCGNSAEDKHDQSNLKQEIIECQTNAHKINEENEKLTEALIQVHIQKQELQDELHDTKIKIDELKVQSITNKDSQSDLKEKLEKTEKELEEKKIGLFKANQEIDEAYQKMTEFKKEIENLRLASITKSDEHLAKENTDLIQQVVNLKSERGKLNRHISELNSNNETLVLKLEQKQFEKSKMERLFMQSQEECDAFQFQLENLAQEMHHMDLEKNVILHEADKQVKEALMQNHALETELHNKTLRINSLEEEQKNEAHHLNQKNIFVIPPSFN